jgi:hypothetical protein
MKLSLLALTCVVVFCLLSPGRVPNNSVSATPARASASNQAIQEPTPPEWDPLRDGVKDIDEKPRTEVAVEHRKDIDILGQRFTPAEFAKYVKTTVNPELRQRGHWRPGFIVLHHTGVPSIRQRPQGFTSENMKALAHYYGNEGWRSGPHVFIDQNGIWVFTRLTRRGTHSPSWNRVAWGIEQLGNFITENYQDGDGAKIRDNAIAAIAILSVARGFNAESLLFHREDRRTTHKDCPGKTCKKPDVVAKVKSEIEVWRGKWSTL